MKVTILGSGTLFPDDRRRSAAYLVEAEGVRLLLDCGSGAVHGMARPRHGWPGAEWAVASAEGEALETGGATFDNFPDGDSSFELPPVKWQKITHLALTHFHTDHVGDIPALLFALKHGIGRVREGPLVVLGPPGVRRFWGALAKAFGEHLVDPGFPLEIVEMNRSAAWRSADGRLGLRTHPTPHTEESVAFRVETAGGSVGYTGDTGPDPGVARFLAGVDLLIAECSLPDPPEMDTHLTPGGVAEMARESRPGLLVLTHLFPDLDPRAVPERVAAAGYDGPTVTGRDGLVFTVPTVER